MSSIISGINLSSTAPAALDSQIAQAINNANQVYIAISRLVNQSSTLVFNNPNYIPYQVAVAMGTQAVSFFSTIQTFYQTMGTLAGTTNTFIPKTLPLFPNQDGSATFPVTPPGNPIPP